jgi:hypothetical protein
MSRLSFMKHRLSYAVLGLVILAVIFAVIFVPKLRSDVASDTSPVTIKIDPVAEDPSKEFDLGYANLTPGKRVSRIISVTNTGKAVARAILSEPVYDLKFTVPVGQKVPDASKLKFSVDGYPEERGFGSVLHLIPLDFVKPRETRSYVLWVKLDESAGSGYSGAIIDTKARMTLMVEPRG